VAEIANDQKILVGVEAKEVGIWSFVVQLKRFLLIVRDGGLIAYKLREG